MKTKKIHPMLIIGALVLAPIAPILLAQQNDEEDDIVVLSPFVIDSPGGFSVSESLSGTRLNTSVGKLNVTVGGAQDITYFRDQIANGSIPTVDAFTIEGLLSEHDLPIEVTGDCAGLICVGGQAMPTEAFVDDKTTHVAQLGFGTGIDASTWQRAPLNLVAVVDKSGSMSGPPLALVRDALRAIAEQLRPEDQLSIVLYGSTVDVHLEPTLATAKNFPAILSSIGAIQSHGSTAMEEGLHTGYSLARRSAKAFNGQTRLMLFTDEQPNVGRTDAGSFMRMARSASNDKIGLTTIGVGTHFGAELATEISAVRGGNLYFFEGEEQMLKLFQEELDTHDTELAGDFELTVSPAEGMRITGVYGIPGDMVEWIDERDLKMTVETLFASRQAGGIFFGFGPEEGHTVDEIASVGHARSSYIDANNGHSYDSTAEFALVDRKQAAVGLVRGEILVNQYAAMAEASRFHHERKDDDAAWKAVYRFAKVFAQVDDESLQEEKQLIAQLESILAMRAGKIGSPSPLLSQADHDHPMPDVVGVWEVIRGRLNYDDYGFLSRESQVVFWPSGGICSIDLAGQVHLIGNVRWNQKGFEILDSSGYVETEASIRHYDRHLYIEFADEQTTYKLEPAQLRISSIQGTSERDPVTGLPIR